MTIATDPPVSEKQRRAMWAAAEGRSTLGIPKRVGKEFVSKDSGAGVALQDPEGALLFMRRNKGGDHAGTWAFPGGLVEKGEEPEEAARRELDEETGHSHDGPMSSIDNRLMGEGLVFNTFGASVPERFAPKMNGEHDGYVWATPDQAPSPLHPGVKATLDMMKKAKGRDMKPRDWQGLLGLLTKFFGEEADEPEHAEDQKLPKAEVDYSAGKDDHRCGNCEHFIPDQVNTELGTCQLVAGVIDPAKWCQLFAKKSAADSTGTNQGGSAPVAPHWVKVGDYVSNQRSGPPFKVVDIGRQGQGYLFRLENGQSIGPIYPSGTLIRWDQPAHDDNPSGKLTEKERAEADRNHGSREEMSGEVFLESASRKYPVKEKRDGEWKYSRDLLLAAAREARMHGHEELARKADAIRNKEFGNASAHDSALALDKASVRTYDKDGRLHVATANISKAAVNPYKGSEIPDYEKLGLEPDKIYRLLRHPDELRKAAPSFNNLPILSEHVPVTAMDYQPDLVIGSTGTDSDFSDPHLRNSLVFWAKPAIDAIDSGDQKELSSAYHYRADMTPGNYEGEKYDGIMRDIVGNHVALVTEGRAGPTVVVGDSKLNGKVELSMKKGLSRTATMALGAVVGYLRPKLAADAKLDVAPLFGEVTAENFKDKKAGIITGLKTQLKGKLANDAELDGVGKVLDSIEELKPNSAPPPGAKKSGEDDELDDEPEATDEEKDEERRRVLSDHLRGTGMDEDKIKAAVDAAYGAKQAGDEPPPFNGKPKSQTADAEPPITKKAMDAAIAASTKSAVTAAVKQQQDIHEAERFVRRWVGDLDMAFDSAEHVYRTALTGLGVENKDIHPSGLRAVLEAQPVPGAKMKSAARPAMDAAATNSFAEMFPGAARIRNL